MSFDSDIEHSDVESIGSRSYMCERELEKDREELVFRSRRTQMDEPIADVTIMVSRIQP